MEIALQVQVPSHSLSFEVSLPPGATVLDLKHAIQRQCQGQPSVDGQRVISRGRVLNDPEEVGSIWKATDESRVVYVAVHPSAWRERPPNPSEAMTGSSSTSPSQDQQPNRFQIQDDRTFSAAFGIGWRRIGSSQNSGLNILTSSSSNLTVPVRRSTAKDSPQTLAYVHYIHSSALRALTKTPSLLVSSTTDLQSSKEWSKMIVESYGHQWPEILDQDFPGSLSNEGEGVLYKTKFIHGSPYLEAASPASAIPTPLQKRALEILTYTFPLLSYTYQPSPFGGLHTGTEMTSTNSLIRLPRAERDRAAAAVAAVGAAAAAAAPVRNRPALPPFPFRALIAPFIMLCLRTVFLLYVLSPSRKPLIALIITGWVIWDIWAALQAALARERRGERAGANGNGVANADGNAGGANVPNANGNANAGPGNQNGNANPPANPNPNPAPELPNIPNQLLDRLASLNLDSENRALLPPNPDPSPYRTREAQRRPSIFHRTKMLIVLFILTIHPGIWIRRRDKLRHRERIVQKERRDKRAEEEIRQAEEAAARRDAENGQESSTPNPTPTTSPTAPLRPAWLEEYIDKVERAEWVDG